jgi:uncharacterized protein YecA (UPF0149 family)
MYDKIKAHKEMLSDLEKNKENLHPEDKKAFHLIKELHRIASVKRKVKEGKIKRPGRNEPCVCGSGEKYKRCCA